MCFCKTVRRPSAGWIGGVPWPANSQYAPRRMAPPRGASMASWAQRARPLLSHPSPTFHAGPDSTARVQTRGGSRAAHILRSPRACASPGAWMARGWSSASGASDVAPAQLASPAVTAHSASTGPTLRVPPPERRPGPAMSPRPLDGSALEGPGLEPRSLVAHTWPESEQQTRLSLLHERQRGADPRMAVGRPLHLLALWNPAYSGGALDVHLSLLLEWSRRRGDE